MNAFMTWLLTFMTTVAPTNRPQWYPDAKETQQEADSRYASIATDIQSVVYRPDITPLFSGPNGRAKSATVVLGIMTYESGFRRDVDLGLGAAGRGDGGRSWCLMQIQAGSGRTATWNKVKSRFKQWGDDPSELVEGWTGPEMVADRKKCIEAGYRIVQASFAMCKSLPVNEWLRVYASGSTTGGSPESRARMNTALNWYNNHQPMFTDAEIMAGSPTIASNP